MGFEIVDRYLLGDPVSKPDVVAAFLAERSALPAAQPFYRALDAVGVRAADEAFIALRLVLAGKEASDDAVRRLRAIAAVARAAGAGDRASVRATLERDRPLLGEALAGKEEAAFDGLRSAAKNAYEAELA